jgi:hypothetical protein
MVRASERGAIPAPGHGAIDLLEALRDLPAAAIAELLQALAAERDDDPAFARAARTFIADGRGRPAYNDDSQLSEMAELIELGMARSVEDAARMVAMTMLGQHSVPATTRRLAKKFRRRAERGVGNG